MITFKQLLESLKPQGNYVAIYAKTGIEFPSSLKFNSGELVPLDKQHVTLIYSTETELKPESIKLKSIKGDVKAEIIGVDYFDDAIVLLLSSPVLQSAHDELVDLGLKHTFDFTPHLTILYKVQPEDIDAIIKQLKQLIGNIVVLDKVVSEPIKENWSDDI